MCSSLSAYFNCIPMITKSYNLLIVCIEIVCRYKNELNYDECITFKTKNLTLDDINQRSEV